VRDNPTFKKGTGLFWLCLQWEIKTKKGCGYFMSHGGKVRKEKEKPLRSDGGRGNIS